MDITDFKILINERKIIKRIKILAKELDDKFKDEKIVLICVLKGAVVFYSRLLQYIKNKNIELDFIQLRSYAGINSTGQINLVKDVSLDLKGKNVVLIEDIVDTGLTMEFLFKHFKIFEPKSIMMCTLVQKPEKLKVKIDMPLTVGFKIENKFIIGFGLDLDEKYRNLKDIMVLDN